MKAPWFPCPGFTMVGIVPCVMLDQSEAFADTTELTESLFVSAFQSFNCQPLGQEAPTLTNQSINL